MVCHEEDNTRKMGVRDMTATRPPMVRRLLVWLAALLGGFIGRGVVVALGVPLATPFAFLLPIAFAYTAYRLAEPRLRFSKPDPISIIAGSMIWLLLYAAAGAPTGTGDILGFILGIYLVIVLTRVALAVDPYLDND